MPTRDTGSKTISSIRKVTEKAKPPAAFAGGGLDVAELLNPVRQAFPAHMLWLLIRIAGMKATADNAGHAMA
jgi:hypothetical protein